MTERSREQRREVLTDLVRIRVPLSSAVAAVSRLGWDSEDDVVVIGAEDIAHLLRLYLNADLTAQEVAEWADALETREDIGFSDADKHLVRKFIFETANPQLAEPVTQAYARRWLDLLASHAATG